MCVEGIAKDAAVLSLQKAFAVLQFGIARFASPAEFVDSLQLPRSIQQDAEEFLKVLLSLLHERFSLCEQPAVKTVIPRVFAGSLAYSTVCLDDPSHVFRSGAEEFYELVSAVCE